MLKNRKILKKFLILLLIIACSILSSFIYSNFEIFKNLKKEERVIRRIDIQSLESEKLEINSNNLIPLERISTLLIKNKGKYINKLKFNYEANADFSWTIEIKGYDIYNNTTTKIINNVSSHKINVFSENINLKVDTIKIILDGSINKINNFEIDNELKINNYVNIYFMFLYIGIYIIIKYISFFVKKIEYGFLLIALIAGIIIINFVPKFTFVSWDDETHFLRSYKLLDGLKIEWTNSANEMKTPIPLGIEKINTIEEYQATMKYFDTNDKTNTIIEERDSSFIEYLRYPYIFSALGIKLGQLLNVSFSTMFMMGKYANLFVYIFISFFAIKIIPCKKKLLTFIALLPSSVWLATQYSCDSLITSSIFLAIAIFLKEINSKNRKLTIKYAFLFIISLLLASFAKAIYIPLILLILLLPKEKFNSKKECIIFKLGIIGIFILISSTFVLPTIIKPQTMGDYRVAAVDVSTQGSIIKNHIFSYAKVLCDNAGRYFLNRMFSETSLISFGYMGNINSFNIYYFVVIVLMFLTFTDQKNNVRLKNRDKFAIIFIFLSIVALIWTSMYIAYTAVGAMEIQGVQYRYFIPLIFPLLICFSDIKIKNEMQENKFCRITLLSAFIILMISIYLNILKILLL